MMLQRGLPVFAVVVVAGTAMADVTVLSSVREIAVGGQIYRDLTGGRRTVIKSNGLDNFGDFTNPVSTARLGVWDRETLVTDAAGVPSFLAEASQNSDVGPTGFEGRLEGRLDLFNSFSPGSDGALRSGVRARSLSSLTSRVSVTDRGDFEFTWDGDVAEFGDGSQVLTTFQVGYRRLNQGSFTLLASGEGDSRGSQTVRLGSGTYEFVFLVDIDANHITSGSAISVVQSSARLDFELAVVPAPSLAGLACAAGALASRRRR